MMPEEKLVMSWAALDISDQFHTPHHCINATAIGIYVLAKLRVLAKPLYVSSMFINEKGLDGLGANIPPHEWDDDAWSTGSDPREESKEGHMAGHLIIETPTVLLDLSAGQFSRPARDLTVPPIVVMSSEHEKLTPRGTRMWGAVRDRTTILYVEYRETPYLDKSGFSMHEDNMDLANQLLTHIEATYD